ncbi:MAG: DUF308 domain-containing protein [Alphaproteobacteria bacterium]|nr:DUF308 domain-containing protein [Alphaproteobacteria bacterium]
MSEKTQIMTIDTIKRISFWRMVIGIIMIVLGLFILFNPLASLIALALYIGIAFIFAGIGYIVTSFSFQSGWELFVGILDMFIGIIFVTNLGVTAATLPIIFAVWCLATGIIQSVGAYKLHQLSLPWVWSLAMGIFGVLFSFLILAYPLIGILTISAIMGLYVIVYGALSLMEYFYLPQTKA